MAKFDGVKMRIGTAELIVPPLTVNQVRKLRPSFDAMTAMKGMPTDEQMGAIMEICHAAVSRNYPDMSVEQLGERMDLVTMQAVAKAAMGQSGLEVVQGEG